MKKENKNWEEEFEDKFVEDNILDCIPKENWEEMKDEVIAFIKSNFLLKNKVKEILNEREKELEVSYLEKIGEVQYLIKKIDEKRKQT